MKEFGQAVIKSLTSVEERNSTDLIQVQDKHLNSVISQGQLARKSTV